MSSSVKACPFPASNVLLCLDCVVVESKHQHQVSLTVMDNRDTMAVRRSKLVGSNHPKTVDKFIIAVKIFIIMTTD